MLDMYILFMSEVKLITEYHLISSSFVYLSYSTIYNKYKISFIVICLENNYTIIFIIVMRWFQINCITLKHLGAWLAGYQNMGITKTWTYQYFLSKY